MYAIIEAGGRQWKVESGTRLEINRLEIAVGATHTLDHVLLAHNGEHVQVGRPYIQGAKVVCEVIEHRLGPKVISYHFRRRENWRKTVGHRQPLTRLVVKDVICADASGSPAAEAVKSRTSKPRTPKAKKTTRKQ